MSVLTGFEFKQQYPNYQAVKIIGNNHNNYHYQLGLNIDPIPFQPSGYCQAGGLYFTSMQCLPYYMERHGYEIAYIEIIDDCIIYLEDCLQYKTDKLFITKIISIQDFFSQLSDKQFMDWSYAFGHYIIKHIPNAIKEWQLIAVKQNGSCIQYIINPDKDVQLAAVRRNGSAIQYINDPDIEVQLASVESEHYALSYIKNPSLAVIEKAIKKEKELLLLI
jgi:hypothetical protein